MVKPYGISPGHARKAVGPGYAASDGGEMRARRTAALTGRRFRGISKIQAGRQINMPCRKEGDDMAAKAMKQLECPPDCGFMVRSHDEKEILEMAKNHAKNIHKMKISDKELKEMIRPASA
jgi:predicted small metal-binding protein